MHSMAVKNSRARSGFLIYSYFKDSVFTAVIFPFARLSLFSLGNILHIPSQYYSLAEKLVAAFIVIKAGCRAKTISS